MSYMLRVGCYAGPCSACIEV